MSHTLNNSKTVRFSKNALILAIAFGCLSFSVVSCLSKKVKIEEIISGRVELLLEPLEAGEFKEVARVVDSLVKARPSTTNGFRVLEELYDTLLVWDEIDKCLENWGGAGPKDHTFWTLRGGRYIKKAWASRGGGWGYTVTSDRDNKFREFLSLAKIDLENAYSLNPSDPESASQMIVVAKGLGLDRETMELWFQRSIEADPGYYQAYSAKLEYLAPKWRGSPREYFSFATDCLNNSPKGSVVHNVMLECLTEFAKRVPDRTAFLNSRNVHQILQDIFEKTLAEFPKSVSVRNDLAVLQEMAGKNEEALAILKETLAIDPDNISALQSAGTIIRKYHMKDTKFAEDAFKKVIQINPSYAAAYFSLAKVYMEDYKDVENAITYLDKAVSLAPLDTTYLIQRAIYKFGSLHDYKSAKDDFTGVLKLDPRHIDGYYGRAKSRMELDEIDDAMRDFQRALGLISEEKSKGDAASLPQADLDHLGKRINGILNGMYVREATEITPAQAARICKKGRVIQFLKLKSISPEVAEIFHEKGGDINLPSLSKMSREAAKMFAGHRGKINLPGLSAIDPVVAENLAKTEGALILSGLTTVSVEVARALTSHKRGALKLEGLRSLSPQAANHLSKVSDLHLNGLAEVPDEVLGQLCQNRGSLHLCGLEKITEKQAECLSAHEGKLFLCGLKSLSTEVVCQLSRHKGLLSLSSLKSLSSDAARCLKNHKGPLYLYNVTSIPDETASYLYEHEKEIGLTSLQSITPKVAELLVKASHNNISLRNIKEMTPEVARILVKHSGVLFLRGLKDLDAETARILCQHQNEVSLKGLEAVSNEVMEILKNCPHVNLSKKLKVKLERD